jgi:signal transduction histidine kinase
MGMGRSRDSACDELADLSAVQEHVFAAQTRDLYSKGRVALATNVVNSVILVVVLWRMVDHRSALTWLFVMNLVVAVRFWGWDRQRSLAGDGYDARRWARLWTMGAALTGVGWGLTAIFLFPRESVAGQMFVLFLIGGMVAGASASMSSLQSAFVAFVAPALGLAIVRLVGQFDEIHGAMAVLLAIFGGAMAAIARRGEKALTGVVRLEFRNSLLAEKLTTAYAQLAQMNRELEDRVSMRTDALHRALAARDQFISIASHELRTPVSSMRLNSAILARLVQSPGEYGVKLKQLSAALSRQLDRVCFLLDDMLDASRMTAGKMTYTKAHVRLGDIIREVLEQLEPQLSAEQATIALDVSDDIWGEWDGHRIEQVFVNLLSNALKYGRPPFSVSALGEPGTVCTTVHDAGGGIAAEHLEQLFEPFERAHASENTSGLGLGLYICRRIVEAHQGTISVTSSPSQGTSFLVRLPVVS